ncbi:MAG: ATP-binding cassette domain-containing protein [Bacteroidetes bacterium]|nr:MAG: ATP-binding cassette domain-containing protein [Bacteroidota bacterium]
MDYILKIDNVSKCYEGQVAVDTVSLQIPQGSIFGLLGPNGAGKTSLIRMITTITRPDTGHIELLGQALNSEHPKKIGYLPEERGLYKKMKVGEHLLYLARLKGLSKNEATTEARQWLERLELGDRWDQPVEALSKGLQQQVQFIATVIHRPPLLILDEPFSGLDPVNTNRLKDEIRALHAAGTSIIFSTHRMEQVEEICEYIALINRGQKVLDGRVSEVRESYKQHHFKLEYRGELSPSIREQFKLLHQAEGQLTFAAAPDKSTNDLLRILLDMGVQIRAFSEILPSLNDIFIRTVSKQSTAQTTST